MAVEVFVDESIRSGNYMLAAVTVEVGDLAAKRSALRKMLLPGERRMHLSKETVVRRRVLLDQIAREGFSVGVFSCRAPVTLARRLWLIALSSTPDNRCAVSCSSLEVTTTSTTFAASSNFAAMAYCRRRPYTNMCFPTKNPSCGLPTQWPGHGEPERTPNAGSDQWCAATSV